MNTTTADKTPTGAETTEIFAVHPAGSVDLTAELPGERVGTQARSGSVTTLSAIYWVCC
ncbi:hypothetical protein [Streptomyces sp. NPDC001135]